MSTFLTADTHFGHPLMLTACNRPYANVHEMNEALVRYWNSVVHPKDTVWHLGDFSMKLDNREMAEIFYALNGRKHLIIGNHDVLKDGGILPGLERLGWESISHAAEIKHDGQRIMLSHYAGWTWNAAHKGAFQAFGHSHGDLVGLPGSIDVGVDAQEYAPISAEEFVRQAENSILKAKSVVDKNLDRLTDLLEVYKDRAADISAKRKALAALDRAPDVDHDEGDEMPRGFRR
jgi:calcineurin-like phosphoesterase family protein